MTSSIDQTGSGASALPTVATQQSPSPSGLGPSGEYRLAGLIERLEAADVGSRGLDREIATLYGLPWDYAADWGSRGHEQPTAFPYTTSLDAAMSLYSTPGPETHTAVFWQLGNDGEGGDPALFKARILIATGLTSTQHIGLASTAPLALCIAALRAKEVQS